MIHRRLLELAGAVPAAVLGLAAFGLFVSALHIAFAFVLAVTVAALIRGDGEPWPPLAALAAITAIRAVALWGREVLAARVGASVRVRLRRRLLRRLADVPAAERDSAVLATTVLDGVEGLDPYYTRYLPQLIVVMIVPAGVVAVVWAQSPPAGAVLALAAAVSVLAPRVWDARLLRVGRTRWDRLARLSSGYVEALQNIPLLRTFGATDRFAREFARDAEDLRDATMRQLRVSLVESALSALSMQLGTVLAIAAVLAGIITGDAAPASAVAVLLLARECFRPVQELGAAWHAGYLGLSAVDGLDRLLTLRPAAAGGHDSPAQAGWIEFRTVSFSHPGTGSGVSDVTLRVSPGETVAIVGASGSGKSTLARLVEGDVVPQHGRVLIDGVDVADYTRAARSRSVVVVPQDPVLFAWTVRENLRLYRPGASDADVEHATRTAQIHDVVRALPHGYDTVLSENGDQLSGGQRQRLAIARALVAAAPILVLDEVTSALDADTERAVVDAIAAGTTGRTLILIAHRESACTHATRWVSLAAGRVIAEGTGAPAADAFAGGSSR